MSNYKKLYCVFAIIIEMIPINNKRTKVYFKNFNGKICYAEANNSLLLDCYKNCFVNFEIEIEKSGKYIIQSIGLYEKPIKLSLCKYCSQAFYNLDNHVIKRVDKNQKIREPCSICGYTHYGYEYLIFEKKGDDKDGVHK